MFLQLFTVNCVTFLQTPLNSPFHTSSEELFTTDKQHIILLRTDNRQIVDRQKNIQGTHTPPIVRGMWEDAGRSLCIFSY